MSVLYRIGKVYKFELKNGMWYTGRVLEEDVLQVSVLTVREEELVLNKSELVQAWLVESKRIGDRNEQRT